MTTDSAMGAMAQLGDGSSPHRLIVCHEDVNLIDDNEQRLGLLGLFTGPNLASLLPSVKHPLQVGQGSARRGPAEDKTDKKQKWEGVGEDGVT